VAPEDFPTIEDVTRLADAAEPRDRLAILLMGRMGLRIGEVFALRVRDVDLKTRRLHVARTVSSESPLTYGPPKTDRGDRRLKLPGWMVDELRAHLERFRPDAGPNDLLVVTSRAEPCRPTNWRSRNYRAAADRARVRVTAHVLRRAAASSWIARGASPTAVAARLGDDVRVVLSTYAHAFPSEDEAIAALDEVDG
jgi:integrase